MASGLAAPDLRLRFRKQIRRNGSRCAGEDGGGPWIRTKEGVSQQIYSLPRLTAPEAHQKGVKEVCQNLPTPSSQKCQPPQPIHSRAPLPIPSTSRRAPKQTPTSPLQYARRIGQRTVRTAGSRSSSGRAANTRRMDASTAAGGQGPPARPDESDSQPPGFGANGVTEVPRRSAFASDCGGQA